MARDCRGVLDMREMPALLDHDEPRIRQPLMPQRRIGRRHDLVVVAPDDERRELDAVQHFSRSGLNQRGCQPSFATVKRFLSITSICSSLGVSARMRSAKDWS